MLVKRDWHSNSDYAQTATSSDISVPPTVSSNGPPTASSSSLVVTSNSGIIAEGVIQHNDCTICGNKF